MLFTDILGTGLNDNDSEVSQSGLMSSFTSARASILDFSLSLVSYVQKLLM